MRMTNDLDWRRWLLDSGESDLLTENKGPLSEVNLELLQLLTRTATSNLDRGRSNLIADLRPKLLKISDRELERLARVPVSLVDVGLIARTGHNVGPGNRSAEFES